MFFWKLIHTKIFWRTLKLLDFHKEILGDIKMQGLNSMVRQQEKVI